MKLDLNLIFNCLVALFLYNMILKSIGASIIKQWTKTEDGKKAKKSFQEKIQDKKDETN